MTRFTGRWQSGCDFRATALAGTLFSLVVSGCVTARVETARLEPRVGSSFAAPAGMNEEGVVVILTRTDYTDQEAEDSFQKCVSAALTGGRAPLRLFSEQDFMDSLFPWFEPRLAPTSAEQLPELLAQPGVREKIAETHVRYLVWVDGSTETVDQGGSMTCAFSPGGGGCIGLSYWEKDSSYEASIWDLDRAATVGNISADATGTSYIAGLVVPIPIIARTQKAACQGLAAQLKEFLTPTQQPATPQP